MMYFVVKCAICTLTSLALVGYTFEFLAVTLDLLDPATKQWRRSLHLILLLKSISYFYTFGAVWGLQCPQIASEGAKGSVELSNFGVAFSKMGSIVVPRLVL